VRTREMDWTALKLLLEGLEGKRVRKRFSLPSGVTKSL
jgi:transposase